MYVLNNFATPLYSNTALQTGLSNFSKISSPVPLGEFLMGDFNSIISYNNIAS